MRENPRVHSLVETHLLNERKKARREQISEGCSNGHQYVGHPLQAPPVLESWDLAGHRVQLCQGNLVGGYAGKNVDESMKRNL